MAATTHGQMAEAIIETAVQDEMLRRRLIDNPADVFIEAGINIPEASREEFNRVFTAPDSGMMTTLQAAGKNGPLMAFPSAKCSGCTIAAWAIAAVIVGIGAAGLAALGPTAPVVVSLAAFAGVSQTVALAFIASLGASVGGGVSAVAGKICTWMNACP